MRTRFPALALSLAGVLAIVWTTTSGASAGRAAPLRVSESQRLYKVTGATAEELRKQMHELGPVDKNGNHGDAYTECRTAWSYDYNPSASGCALGSIDVTVTFVFTFPKWEKPSSATTGLAKKWDAFVRALTAHEDGHRAIALDTANDIMLALRKLPPASTCEDLGLAANGEGQRLLREGEGRQQSYDSITGHGVTQGARLR